MPDTIPPGGFIFEPNPRRCLPYPVQPVLSVNPQPPPNPAIAELIDVLGLDETHGIIRTYLREFGALIRTMASGDREAQHRATHALKSSSRHMGLLPLSRRLEALEARLLLPEGKVKSDDLLTISEEFEHSARPLRAYIGEK